MKYIKCSKNIAISLYVSLLVLTIVLAVNLIQQYRFFKQENQELLQVKESYYQHIDMLKRSLNASLSTQLADVEEEIDRSDSKKKNRHITHVLILQSQCEILSSKTDDLHWLLGSFHAHRTCSSFVAFSLNVERTFCSTKHVLLGHYMADGMQFQLRIQPSEMSRILTEFYRLFHFQTRQYQSQQLLQFDRHAHNSMFVSALSMQLFSVYGPCGQIL